MAGEIEQLLKKYSGTATISFGAIPNLNVNSKGWEDETLLHMVCLQGDILDVSLLIAHGAEINARDVALTSPLHRALACRDIAAAERIGHLLLTAGADPNAQDVWGRTPLKMAEERGLTELSNRMKSMRVG